MLLKSALVKSAVPSSISCLRAVVFASSLVGAVAFAQSDAAAPKQQAPVKAPVKAPAPKAKAEAAEMQSKDTSSRALRGRTHANVTLGGGLVLGSLAGWQAEGFYNIWSMGQVGLGYSAGSKTVDLSDSAFSSKVELTGSILQLKYRQYLFNSLYLMVGVGTRNIKADANINSKSNSDSINLSTNSDSIVGGLIIGNHWSSDFGLTWGCDWVGYYMPVTSSSSSSVSGDGSGALAASSIADDVRDLGKKLGETSNDMALVASLGWQF